jgi:hypothetical protein
MRKLIMLALLGAGVAYVLRQREHQAIEETAGGGGPAPGSAPTSARAAQPTDAQTADTVESDALVPDTSADDPVVRREENAAASQAAAIGGEPDPLPGDTDPAVRPVVEGSGDDEETFEQEIEEEGR